MSKYVDIYDFVSEIPYVVTEANWRGQMVDAYYMWQAICKMAKERKEADIEEVHHGHWISDEDGNISCSVCGQHGVGDNYCEKCGAKMDEVTK